LAADLHAVVPAGEEQVGVRRQQGFLGRILRRDLRQAGELLRHFLVHLVPAGNAGIAGHAVDELEFQHHVGKVEVLRHRPLRRSLEGDLAIAALHRDREAGGERRGGGKGEKCRNGKGNTHQSLPETEWLRWKEKRGLPVAGWSSITASTEKVSRI